MCTFDIVHDGGTEILRSRSRTKYDLGGIRGTYRLKK
jgi:hypothetical protein